MDHTQQHAQALPSEWCAGSNHDRACEGNTAGCCGTRFCGTCGDFVAGVCAYQSNAAETEVMKPVHVAPVKTVPAQMAPAQAQPVTRSVAQAVSQPSPVSVMSEQPVTAQPSPAPLSPPTPPKPAPPLTVVMPDVPNFNVNVTGGITPTSGE